MPGTVNWTLCNRKGRRWSISPDSDATIEFPCGASRLRQRLLEVGTGGLSFLHPTGDVELGEEFEVPEALLRIGRREIRGLVHVVHVTEVPGSGRICGGRFVPATQSDGAAFLELLDELRAAYSLQV